MALDKILKNKLERAIVRFFHENQTAIDTPRGIATWVKAERPAVKAALDKLVRAGILLEDRVSSTTGYSYTGDKKLIRKIGERLKGKL